ncbi:hypothetical protein BaRGS_00023585 [Batillaria attramentaria]|uniref:Uncharacterized protein n=1 Tax=Batillaria attramentaria TaxID=370345 RepID=A0ABD0KDH1_9CAEN
MATGYSSDPGQKNLVCAVCREVFTSPRLLPCHHTFCLSCLEGLARINGQFFPCPACRKRTRVPDGGVSVFQVNFYITEKELELARRPGPRMCPTHEDERLRFLCLQCDTVICRDCKLTKHDGHRSEDLSEAAARCKASLETAQSRLEECIRVVEDKLKEAQEDQAAAQKKREVIEKEIDNRHAVLVAAADKWRDRAKDDLENMAEETEEKLATSTQQVQKALDSLLDLQQRVQYAQEEGHPLEVVEIDREMRTGRGCPEELVKTKTDLPVDTVLLGLHCDVNSLEEDSIRLYMGSPVKLTRKKEGNKENVTFLADCSEGSDRLFEVHAICQGYFGVTRAACNFALDRSDRCRSETVVYESMPLHRQNSSEKKCSLKSYSRDQVLPDREEKASVLFSKSTTPVQIRLKSQGVYSVESLKISEQYIVSDIKELFTVRTQHLLAFDASSKEMLFALLEDQEQTERKPQKETTPSAETITPTKEEPELQAGPRGGVVRLYYNGQSNPIATYTPPQPTSLLTDVCFCHVDGQEKLLVSDWMNDAIHVVNVPKTWLEEGLELSDVKDADLKFERYLASGSGKIVRPTAMNIDHDGNVLIGCGNGWVLRCIMG